MINRDDDYLDRFPWYTATVGNNSNVLLNPVCWAAGTMPDGGWNMCPSSMTGIVFGVYTTLTVMNFVEAMAFSQEAIQMNAL